MPLTLRLVLALTVACFFVAALVAFLGAERQGRIQGTRAAKEQLEFAHGFAERLAPLLERNDLLRMSMLATAGRDHAGARIVILERSGRVAIDTALVLGDRQLGMLTLSGSFQRLIEQNGESLRETLVPVRLGGELIGEVRMQRARGAQYAAFDFGLFATVFLCCMTIVAVGALIAHHWSGRVREITDSLVRLATGNLSGGVEQAAPGELRELGHALQELEKGVQDGLHRVVDHFVAMALQLVDGLERRGLVPAGHGERTARYAGLLAERLELLPADRKELELACRLHDLGKAWVRPGILQKRGPLGEDERQSLRNHPVLAADHLDCLPGLRRVAAIVRHQHERHDGGGHPAALRGERIPLGARVLAIGSAFDLLTTCGDRRTLDWEAALAQMATDRGEVFDPWLLDLFREQIQKSPPNVAADKPVMILPTGTVPYRIAEGEATQEGLDYDLGQELEVMLDEMPPEERP
jgi:HD-GYP domain-containing protein (c-di-GMP phosphodiesterase class II)